MNVSDDEIRESLEKAQLKLQRERGTDLTIFSPRASAMAHHIGDCDDQPALDRALQRSDPSRLRALSGEFRRRLPAAADARRSAGRLHRRAERCIGELGFIGCNLNPDPSGGYWAAPPLTDRYWYPLYEKMVELDVPAMVHVSASCNPNFHATGAHYINADTTAFMQFLSADLFKDFPTLRFIIPHGGGAVPYHWGRYRGLAQDMKRPPLAELIRGHVFFDTCVYHLAGIELLLERHPRRQHSVRLRRWSARCGASTRRPAIFRRYQALHRCQRADAGGQAEDFSGNARRVYPGLAKVLARREAEAGAGVVAGGPAVRVRPRRARRGVRGAASRGARAHGASWAAPARPQCSVA